MVARESTDWVTLWMEDGLSNYYQLTVEKKSLMVWFFVHIAGDETISTEVLEKLSKMSLSDEETRKILEFTGPRSELGPAEKFLQTLLEVPNAFQRINTMLFRASFKDDMLQLEEAVTVLEVTFILSMRGWHPYTISTAFNIHPGETVINN